LGPKFDQNLPIVGALVLRTKQLIPARLHAGQNSIRAPGRRGIQNAAGARHSTLRCAHRPCDAGCSLASLVMGQVQALCRAGRNIAMLVASRPAVNPDKDSARRCRSCGN
jgi:hypothetical protein